MPDHRDDSQFPWAVRFTADARAELQRRAAAKGLNPAALAREVVNAYLAEAQTSTRQA